MPLLHRGGGMGAKGFGLTSVNTFSFIATISSNTTSYNLATAATAAGWNGVAPLVASITVNNSISLSGTGDTTSSALILPSTIPTKSIITLTNNGTIYGAGGIGGITYWKGTTEEAGNASGIGTGGTNNNNASAMPGSGWQNGGSAASGYTAIYMATNCIFNIYNYGTITGGGGGAGGWGANNQGGGNGGNGGIALVQTSTPTVTLYNQSGAVFGGGGGGGSGGGNRPCGWAQGGTTGVSAVLLQNGSACGPGAGNFGAQGIAGQSSTNNATTLFSGSGTYSL
jgi:hypothetical protein